jgi:hypothetical protein
MKIIISNSSITMKTQKQIVPLTGLLTEYAEHFDTPYGISNVPYSNYGMGFSAYSGDIVGIRLMANIDDNTNISVYKIKIQNNSEVSRTLIQTFLPQGMTQGVKVTNDLIFDSPVTLGADEYLFVRCPLYATSWNYLASGYKMYYYNNGNLSTSDKRWVSFDWLVPEQ